MFKERQICSISERYDIVIYGVYILLTSAMIPISGCLSDSNPPPPPSDQEMIQTFEDNKQVFARLQTQIYKDGYSVISMAPEWSDPAEIPLETKKQYYELFRKVNVVQIRKEKRGNTVEFSVWSKGNVSGGDYKGYIFMPGLDCCYKEKESLDNISQPGEEFFYKRKIENDWYLYYAHFL